VLSRELTAFLVEFSVSLHKHAIYPSGHPSLEPAAARLTDIATRLLEGRATLAFGVARHQIIIDGVATDPKHPVLRRLAETLHHHQLGAMSILPGVTADEMYAALCALAKETPDDAGEQRPLDRPHVRFHPLSLDRLEIVDEDPSAAEDLDSEPRRKRAQLWVGLANAAMARDAEVDPLDTVPDADDVAKAIDDRAGAAAYDQVVVGYLLQITEELKNSPSADHGALRRRTAKLIRAVRPETLQRLVTMGGNTAQRKAFVLGATTGMAMDSVVKILKAAAEASNQTISHGMVRMLSKMASHAERGEESLRPVAESELREQVDSLLSGWDLDDPSPSAYAKTLQHLATSVSAPDTTTDGDGEPGYEMSPMHVVQIALEVGGTGPVIERGIDRALDAGHLHSLYTVLTFLPPGAAMTADLIRARLGSARAMQLLMSREPVDLKMLDALAPFLRIDGYEVLLDALITTNNRSTRRKLLERLAPTDLDVGPLIVARLDDERWYVQRNLLLLLERLCRVPPGFDVGRWTQHADPRVRYHGLSLQLNLQDQRESGIHAALIDSDERVRRLGLVACQSECPRPMIPLVAGLAANAQVGPELRMLAVKVLGTCRERPALATLLSLVNGGTTWLGKPKLAVRSPVVLASLRALSGAWASEAEATRLLDLARQSSDPEFRQAVQAGVA